MGPTGSIGPIGPIGPQGHTGPRIKLSRNDIGCVVLTNPYDSSNIFYNNTIEITKDVYNEKFVSINSSILPTISGKYSLGLSNSINENDNLIWENIFANNIYAYNNLQISNIQYISDYRIKEDIQKMNTNYSVENLNPISFINKNTSKPEIGLLAHELQEFYPELVNGEKDGLEYQTINYIGLICLLINDIKNMKLEINAIKNKKSKKKKI
jgi:hypothetical protein